jgi:hypothetical protein
MKNIKYIFIAMVIFQFSFSYGQTGPEIKSSSIFYLDDNTTTPAQIVPDRASNSAFINNLPISDNLQGAVPEDIIYLPLYNKFYVYGKRRLLVIDATTNLITKSLDISDYSQYYPVDMMGITNQTYHEEHLIHVKKNNNDYVYCATKSLEIIKIDPFDDSWELVVQKPTNMGFENYYSNMKIKYDYRTDRIYWAISNFLSGGSVFVYDASNPTLSLINQININDFGEINDLAINKVLDEFYLNFGKEIRVYNSTNFNYSILVSSDNVRGDFLYINTAGKHLLYSFARQFNSTGCKVYQIDFNNNSQLTQFTSPYPTETACYYSSNTDEIYIGFRQIDAYQNDIVVMDPNNNSVINEFNTYIYSSAPDQIDISFQSFNGQVILCKTHEVIAIDEQTYNFTPLEVADYNMFKKCGVSNNNALIISPWSGNINVINSNNVIESKIDVGASLYFGCFNADKSKAYFYNKEYRDKDKVYILNTLTNQIKYVEMGNNISDLFVYAPDENTNRVYVSFFDDTNIVKAIDGETDEITDPQYWIALNEDYCNSMFLAPNNKLYCMVGKDNEVNNDASIEIRDAGSNFAYLDSHYYPEIPSTGRLSGQFCYNPNNNMVYAAAIDLSGFPEFGKLTEIDGSTNVATDYSIDNLPNNIVVNKYNNNVYIQHHTNNENITVYNPKDHSISYVNVGYPVWDIEMDETRNLVFVLYHKPYSQALGFIDYLSFASGIDLPYSTSSIKFNPGNSSIYAYVPHNYWSSNPEEGELWQCTMDSYIDITNYNISTQKISLQNWHTFKYDGAIFENDILIDEAQNKIFVANGGHSNISAVSYEPVDYLQLQRNITWLSIPRHLRTVDPETTLTEDVFAQTNMSVPYTALTLDWNYLNENMPAGYMNPVSAEYSNGGWDFVYPMENIDSRRGYVLYNMDPITERLLKLEGTQESPDSYIELYCKKQNWIGYYLEEEQSVFDALADIEPDIYHIQLQYVNCYRYNYPVSNDCSSTKSTSDYSPGTWICNGTPNIKYGDMVKVTPLGDIYNFQWNYSGNPPSGAIRPEVVYYQYEEKPSYETFVLVLDTTATNPTEIGAFVNDTCVGACSVIPQDSVVVLSAYIGIAPGDSVTFEKHYGSQKNSNIKLSSYLVKNRNNSVFEERAIKTGEKQEAFIINFNSKAISSDKSNFDDEFELYPNPATDNLNYTFNLNKESNIKITLFDINGRKLAVLLNEKLSKGYASGNINLNNIFSDKQKKGIYIINVSIGNEVFNRKLLIN